MSNFVPWVKGGYRREVSHAVGAGPDEGCDYPDGRSG